MSLFDKVPDLAPELAPELAEEAGHRLVLLLDDSMRRVGVGIETPIDLLVTSAGPLLLIAYRDVQRLLARIDELETRIGQLEDREVTP